MKVNHVGFSEKRNELHMEKFKNCPSWSDSFQNHFHTS